MEKILLVGNTSCFTENISFLLRLAGFDLVFSTNIEEAINLIEIKQSFNLLIIPRSELVKAAPEYFGFLNNPARQIKILVVENDGQKLQGKIGFDDFFKSEGISFCESEKIVDGVKKVLEGGQAACSLFQGGKSGA